MSYAANQPLIFQRLRLRQARNSTSQLFGNTRTRLISIVLVSLLVAVIVPRRWADRLSPTWAGLIPAALIFLVLIYEKRWFL